jgi:hypothetical protein
MQDFYIPLNFKVDVDRLNREVGMYIRPVRGDFGITTTKELANNLKFDFRQHRGWSYADENGQRRLESGELDTDIVHWPLKLNGSYIKEVGLMISKLVGVDNPRVRLSRYFDEEVESGIRYHVDPHTPFRIHIALKTNPTAIWKFRTHDEVYYDIHQPADGTPVFIEVNKTSHAVQVPAGIERVHLWYQFHQPIDPAVLAAIKQ